MARRKLAFEDVFTSCIETCMEGLTNGKNVYLIYEKLLF